MASHTSKFIESTPNEQHVINAPDCFRVDALVGRGKKDRRHFDDFSSAVAYAKTLDCRAVMIYAERPVCGKNHGALIAATNSKGGWKTSPEFIIN